MKSEVFACANRPETLSLFTTESSSISHHWMHFVYRHGSGRVGFNYWTEAQTFLKELMGRESWCCNRKSMHFYPIAESRWNWNNLQDDAAITLIGPNADFEAGFLEVSEFVRISKLNELKQRYKRELEPVSEPRIWVPKPFDQLRVNATWLRAALPRCGSIVMLDSSEHGLSACLCSVVEDRINCLVEGASTVSGINVSYVGNAKNLPCW